MYEVLIGHLRKRRRIAPSDDSVFTDCPVYGQNFAAVGKRNEGSPAATTVGMKQPATRLHGAHYPEVLNIMIADGLPADETTPLRQKGSRYGSSPYGRRALLAPGFGLRAVDERCVVASGRRNLDHYRT